jgi:hypothetical protein
LPAYVVKSSKSACALNARAKVGVGLSCCCCCCFAVSFAIYSNVECTCSMISSSRPKSRVARLTRRELAHRTRVRTPSRHQPPKCVGGVVVLATNGWTRRVSARVQTKGKFPAYHCRCGSRLESYKDFPAQVSRRKKRAPRRSAIAASKPLAFLRKKGAAAAGVALSTASTLGAEQLTSSVARHDGFAERSSLWIG